ncbi:FMN-dependent NADH-azoreductase [Kordiimonas aquimaris]|uniref:FMN-dependent NADH-azoreductase n=1 Tax=Kordiimonas aquimaris TaxID=707591 RepID=UPI0021D3352B|nr:NAD(P)H-dependent oxidoreductase [Kordiimonas aquimaris]
MKDQPTERIHNILRVDSSARQTGSISRDIADRLISTLNAQGRTSVTTRNVANGIPFVDEEWISANFTPPESRTKAQQDKLAYSDMLVSEIAGAETLVISLPIYNFSIPASFKAWIDMIARTKLTFSYSPNGPVGLMTGKRAFVVVTSGGTPLGSEIDFATPYIKQALKFIGITDVTFIDASTGKPEAIERAKDQITKATQTSS